MSRIRWFVFGFVLLAAGGAIAAQVSSTVWIREYGKGARSDGVYQEKTSNSFAMFVNGVQTATLSKGFYVDFTKFGDGDDLAWQTDGTVLDCTDEVYNVLYLPDGNKFEFASLEGDSTACLDMDAGSLDISGDDVNDEGFEIVAGPPYGSGGHFVVGTDPAFFTCATWNVADADGSDDLHVGFRNAAEAINDAFDDHTSFATIGNISGNITIETDLAGAGTTTTDTTINAVNATATTLCVYVSAAGVVTYTIDGTAPPTTAAFTFNDATSVVPFIYYMNAVGTSGEVDIIMWKAGYQ